MTGKVGHSCQKWFFRSYFSHHSLEILKSSCGGAIKSYVLTHSTKSKEIRAMFNVHAG